MIGSPTATSGASASSTAWWPRPSRSTSWPSALRSGDLSLDFVDDPAYSQFASFTGETFEELSARTGVPLHLLVAMREATGSGVPDPASRVREDEMAILPAIEFQLAHGFQADHRGAQPAGDGR